MDQENIIKYEENSDINGLNCTMCKNFTPFDQAAVLIKSNGLCKTCFLTNIETKFRSTLRKKLVILPTDTILVVHSGSTESTALLHMIKSTLHGPVHKSLRYKICLLYIDVDLNNEQLLERKEKIGTLYQQIQDLGYTSCMSFLSNSLFHSEPVICDLHPDNVKVNDDSVVKDFLDSFNNATDKEDVSLRLRQRLIVYSALKLNCNKIFLDDNASNVAEIILSNISLGRGTNIAMDVGNTDSQFRDVTFLRPLKCMSKKELNYYIKFRNIEKNNFDDVNTYRSTIKDITETFITNLENQGATVTSTICRISEKLKCSKGQMLTCEFCKGILDRQESIMDKMEYININPNQHLNSCSDSSDSMLCYGCNLLFQRYNNKSLPLSTILKNSKSYFEVKSGETCDNEEVEK